MACLEHVYNVKMCDSISVHRYIGEKRFGLGEVGRESPAVHRTSRLFSTNARDGTESDFGFNNKQKNPTESLASCNGQRGETEYLRSALSTNKAA